MLKSIKVRIAQGTQFIADPRLAVPPGYRGKPVIGDPPCADGCSACVQACSTRAITLEPVAVDLGRCVLCGDCEPVCPPHKLGFDADVKTASVTREALVVSAARPSIDPVTVSQALRRRFGRSLKLRSVSAGGCNACELEVNALGNVNFDIGRYGIDIVASPRHADGLVLTGPITRNMAQALQMCWDAMPEPKLVIAVGACAISGSPFEDGGALGVCGAGPGILFRVDRVGDGPRRGVGGEDEGRVAALGLAAGGGVLLAGADQTTDELSRDGDDRFWPDEERKVDQLRRESLAGHFLLSGAVGTGVVALTAGLTRSKKVLAAEAGLGTGLAVVGGIVAALRFSSDGFGKPPLQSELDYQLQDISVAGTLLGAGLGLVVPASAALIARAVVDRNSRRRASVGLSVNTRGVTLQGAF